jgi:hypothetical protein
MIEPAGFPNGDFLNQPENQKYDQRSAPVAD